MELRFWCAAHPDTHAVVQRLSGIAGLGGVRMDADARGLTVRSFSAESVQEAAIRLKELGWRQLP